MGTSLRRAAQAQHIIIRTISTFPVGREENEDEEDLEDLDDKGYSGELSGGAQLRAGLNLCYQVNANVDCYHSSGLVSRSLCECVVELLWYKQYFPKNLNGTTILTTSHSHVSDSSIQVILETSTMTSSQISLHVKNSPFSTDPRILH